jgi:hypothetical protein
MIDLRDSLPRAAWSIGTTGKKTSLTVHYNGPAVPQERTRDGWIEHLKFIADFHQGPYLGADGIQYHYAILPDGTVCQCRNELDTLWHCANGEGNQHSIAVHFPLGGDQRPTVPAWSAFQLLADSLIARHGLVGRRAVYGHRQWPYKSNAHPTPAIAWAAGQSACPGSQITALLESFARDEKQAFRIRTDIDFAAVRQGPARWYPIAWNGTCTLQPGTQVDISEIVAGERIGNNDLWGHWAAAGFIHMSLFV